VVSDLETLDIVDGDHPVAAGLAGSVQVYRDPSRATWSTPAHGGRVIATTRDGRAAIVVHESGAALADGREAPAARLTLFLGGDGFAPWLLTDGTRRIMRAGVTALLDVAA
jgi:hypothetical protein